MVAPTSSTASSPLIPTGGGGSRRQAPRTLSMPVRTSRRSVSAYPDRSGVPLPASGDPPISLPRPLTSADLMEPTGDGLKVAYQGCPGAYSEAAAKKAYPSCHTVPCEYFETAFQAVETCVADRAVLPLENSLGGSIHRNYDLLLRHRLHIVGEALAQCEQTLTKLGIEHREAVDDTAGAAKLIAEQKLQDTGAVASSLAAELYGLDILAQNIQDDTDNVTRFMMLAREPIIPRTDKPFKTSIVFSLEEGPGQLFKALAVFALRKINLTKRELIGAATLYSADGKPPTQGKASTHFDYLFYVDLEASMADPNAQNALGNLKEFATFLRVLGSYPTDVSEA
ncbi:Arogenate dehydratase/prephenate dehydratase 2, chloroplastic [Dichanthelium oligosanthes]|uniref:arogenate dehydratase n=1 Tax=Dichanthelium oligosanthes TaxID=888268 RepID=A0A1E5VGG4_9POAL|nr:Arogenate dehydratase/prephenate dehydratase 2, chloroplastic [Dichanthelium oligosanthes]